ncbi:WD40/YVTN/BNR-like repeat-containing protein [Chitinimonas sp.]|uniref:WD40/YVTN/BNR-like repeat-containing protein n=1 Tax=Chitinimonas sp. TaxID=1934313 RepID=UPI0035B2578B
MSLKQYLINSLPARQRLALNVLAALCLHGAVQPAHAADWRIGSGSDTDRAYQVHEFRSLTVDKNGRYFALSSGAGRLFKSRDGQHWTASPSGIGSGLAGDLQAIVATANGELYLTAKLAVYRSQDGGDSWSRIDQGLPLGSQSGAYFGTIGRRLVVAADGSVFLSVCQTNSRFGSCTLYQRKGETWVVSQEGYPSLARYEIPVFAIDGEVYSGAPGPVSVSRYGSDGKWQASGQGLPEGEGSPAAMTRDGSGSLYLAMGKRVFKRSAASAAWVATAGGLPDADVYSLLVADGTALYAGMGNGSVYRSLDGGDHWAPFLGVADPAGQAIESMVRAADGQVLAYSINGVFRATASGWQRSNEGLSLAVAEPEYTSLLFAESGKAYALGQKHALLISKDGGSLWETSQSASSAMPGLIDGQQPAFTVLGRDGRGNILVGTKGRGVLRSGDGGNSWTLSGNGLPLAQYGENCAVEAIAGDASGTVYLGTRGCGGTGLYKSVDGGASWQASGNGLGAFSRVSSLASDGKGAVYAAALDPLFQQGAVYRSVDAGNSWVSVNQGIPAGMAIRQLTIDAAGTVFGAASTLGGVAPAGVFRLQNGNWLAADAGLDRRSSGFSLASAGDGKLYAAPAGGGIYVSSNQGASWQPANDGLPRYTTDDGQQGIAEITALAGDANGKVLAGSGYGVFRLDAATPASNAHLAGIGARANVLTGDNVLIAGFTIAGGSKTVLIDARGPSLASYGVSNTLSNPRIRLFNSRGEQIAANQGIGNGPDSPKPGTVEGLPLDPREDALLLTLASGAYSVVLDGLNGSTGNALLGVNAVVNPAETGALANLSFRSVTASGDSVAIAGFTVVDGPKRMIITAKGPSLAALGVSGALPAPTIDLYDQLNGKLLESNEQYGKSANIADIQASGFAPGSPTESAIIRTFNPGVYSVVARGANGAQGVTLVEINPVK